MRFLVAPDKFKGTFGGAEVAAAIASGLREAGAEAVEMPVADGGEGTADALLAALGGERSPVATEDALGRPVEGHIALLGDGRRAVVEVAEASGMWRLDPDEMDALAASSRGTGVLVAEAVRAGADEVIVAAGGSATTDGGAGILEVLERAGVSPRLLVACDVDVPFEQAAAVFAPQKGASPDEVAELSRRLERLADAAPRDPRGRPRTGCGGGISGGLWAYRGAELVPGADLVLDAIGFDPALAGCDAVVTGEGRLDSQTATGKAVAVVARRAAAVGKPCHAVVGSVELEEGAGRDLGLASVAVAGEPQAMRAAARRLAD